MVVAALRHTAGHAGMISMRGGCISCRSRVRLWKFNAMSGNTQTH